MRCTLCLHEAAGNQSMRSENLKAVKFAIKSVKTNPSFSNPRIKNAVNPLTASLLTSLLSNALCWKTETYCTELTNKHSVSFFVQKTIVHSKFQETVMVIFFAENYTKWKRTDPQDYACRPVRAVGLFCSYWWKYKLSARDQTNQLRCVVLGRHGTMVSIWKENTNPMKITTQDIYTSWRMRQDFEFGKGLNSNLFPSGAGRRHHTQMA